MKWYLGLNEAGTHSELGLHARIAVSSALSRTDLEPHLLYTGARNDFTEWMEARGVRVIDVDIRFENEINVLAAQGRYPKALLGHWLRSQICLLETVDEFVAYTDCDVLFVRHPDFGHIRPEYFACAPEFKVDNWNYCNTGAMVINVPSLRRTYPEFHEFVVSGMRQGRGHMFNDQAAYNELYRRRWERLDPRFNWKPYWGINEAAPIIHFHGPKLEAIRAILDGRWDWTSEYGRQLGSLLCSSLPGYERAVRALLDCAERDLPEKLRMLQQLADDLAREPALSLADQLDLSFMNFRYFADD